MKYYLHIMNLLERNVRNIFRGKLFLLIIMNLSYKNSQVQKNLYGAKWNRKKWNYLSAFDVSSGERNYENYETIESGTELLHLFWHTFTTNFFSPFLQHHFLFGIISKQISGYLKIITKKK